MHFCIFFDLIWNTNCLQILSWLYKFEEVFISKKLKIEGFCKFGVKLREITGIWNKLKWQLKWESHLSLISGPCGYRYFNIKRKKYEMVRIWSLTRLIFAVKINCILEASFNQKIVESMPPRAVRCDNPTVADGIIYWWSKMYQANAISVRPISTELFFTA